MRNIAGAKGSFIVRPIYCYDAIPFYMEQFYANTMALPLEQRHSKFNQIIAFLRQHNAHEQADAFLELKNCYPTNSFIREDTSFRAYMAWNRVYEFGDHKIVRHIVSQG